MSTITKKQEAAIRKFLKGKRIRSGLGSEKETCSLGAINYALYGKLTDAVPYSMSEVIGGWVNLTQDAMDDELRNSAEWRRLLPLAAGTGRDAERERARLAVIMDWMWETVLPSVQPLAEQGGFGAEWLAMTTAKTAEAAWAAWSAWSATAAEGAAEASAEAAWVAWTVVRMVWAMRARRAAWSATAAAEWAAEGAVWAADAIAERAEWAAWERFDPCDLLARLIAA